MGVTQDIKHKEMAMNEGAKEAGPQFTMFSDIEKRLDVLKSAVTESTRRAELVRDRILGEAPNNPKDCPGAEPAIGGFNGTVIATINNIGSRLDHLDKYLAEIME